MKRIQPCEIQKEEIKFKGLEVGKSLEAAVKCRRRGSGMVEDDVKEVEKIRSFGDLEVIGKNLDYILSTMKCQQNIDTLYKHYI